MAKYEYIVLDQDERYPEHASELKINCEPDVKEIAEFAALEYHYKNDYVDWPALFEIFKDGKSIGKVFVELEMEPVFYASEVKSVMFDINPETGREENHIFLTTCAPEKIYPDHVANYGDIREKWRTI